MMVIFIKHVLGVGMGHPRLLGNTSAYYGMVEQQGHLTLHLHILIWIAGSLLSDKMKKQLMNPQSDFQKKIIEYLEKAHVGEFLMGSMDEIVTKINDTNGNDDYVDPTLD